MLPFRALSLGSRLGLGDVRGGGAGGGGCWPARY